MLKHKRIYCIVLSVTFVVTAFITISIPNYYKCTVLLAPELSTNSKGMGSLASLASNFGINLNNVNMGSDALLPNLYPDLMNSVAFRASLFSIKVQREDEDTMMTYYDYLKYGQKVAWWEFAANSMRDWVDDMLPSDKGHTKRNVPLSLTKEQFRYIREEIVADYVGEETSKIYERVHRMPTVEELMIINREANKYADQLMKPSC